jgi:zinc D-Ala-D-Ala dipeptidase
MRTSFLFLVLASGVFAAPTDFGDIKKYDFSIKLDIKYATKENFTKEKVYPEARCLLRKPVAEALSRVQASLRLRNLGLKVYDCYRPLSIQKKFWDLVKDERYVAHPDKGSKHNRGAAVDLTLVDPSGEELEMPTPYDDFTEKAHRNYQGGDKAALRNRKTLEVAMAKEGFIGLDTEWWHFDHKDWEKYSLEDVSFSAVP